MHNIKPIFIILICCLFGFTTATGQMYFTKNASINFLSEAPLETIKAFNTKGLSVIDLETNKIEFSVLIKAFQFKKALMQKHFNENYLESNKYPKASFKGEFEDMEDILINLTDTVHVLFDGELTIHGITNIFKSEVMLTKSEESILATLEFEILLSDYNIKIPSVVKNNISKSVTISVEATYKPLDNE